MTFILYHGLPVLLAPLAPTLALTYDRMDAQNPGPGPRLLRVACLR